jgi:hypothetical protein
MFSNEGWYPHKGTQFFLMGGYLHQLNWDWSLHPQLFTRYVHHTPLAVNVGMFAGYQNHYFAGVNYQTGQNTLSFSIRGFVSDNLRLGYSYDIYLGTIRSAQHGSHEISLSWMMHNLWGTRNRWRSVSSCGC